MSELLLRAMARKEWLRRQPKTVTADCTCFPDNEQPTFDSAEELRHAAAVKCGVHGDRFDRSRAVVALYRSPFLKQRREQHQSAQFRKAMAVVKPSVLRGTN